MTIRRRPPAMEPARSDPNQQIPPRGTFDHPGLGLEARDHRTDRGRLVGTCDGAVQCLAGAVRDLSGRGLADRRSGRRKTARCAGGGGIGLLVRARLFRARALLDRQCLPGRRADFCLADAVRGARPAGLPCPIPGARLRAGAPDLDAGCLAGAGARDRAHGQRMGTRLRVVGIPVECLRLRAVGAAGAGADGVADRAVGHDLPGGRDLCQPGGADRRVFARPKALDRAGGGAVAARGDGCLRRSAAGAAADRTDQGQAAHHAAEPAAGRQIQLRRQGGGDAEIPCAVRPRFGTAIHRRARRADPDLAGIGVPVLPDARGRRDGADRRAAAEGHRADDRLGARPGRPPRRPRQPCLQLDISDRP